MYISISERILTSGVELPVYSASVVYSAAVAGHSSESSTGRQAGQVVKAVIRWRDKQQQQY